MSRIPFLFFLVFLLTLPSAHAIVSPNVTHLAPPNGTEYACHCNGATAVNVEFNVTADNNTFSDLDNATLHIWFENGTRFNYSSLEFVDIYFIHNGAYVSGEIENLTQEDNEYMHFVETTSGLEVEFNWSGVDPEIDSWHFHFKGRYEGHPSHKVSVLFMNHSSGNWTAFDSLERRTTDETWQSPEFKTVDVIGTGSHAHILFNHSDEVGYHAGDDLFIDYLVLHSKHGEPKTIQVRNGTTNSSYVNLPIGTYWWNYIATDKGGLTDWFDVNYSITVSEYVDLDLANFSIFINCTTGLGNLTYNCSTCLSHFWEYEGRTVECSNTDDIAEAVATYNETTSRDGGEIMYAGFYLFLPLIAIILMLIAFLLPDESEKFAERIALSMGSAIFFIASYFLTTNLTTYEGPVEYTFDVPALRALWVGMFFLMVLYSIWSFMLAGKEITPHEDMDGEEIKGFSEEMDRVR